MMNVWKIIPIIFVAIVLTISARAQSLPDLPKFPISPLSKADYDGLAKSDNQEGWKALAERSRKTATEYFKKQLYDESASWIYTGYAAEMFAEHGEGMPFELKKAILEDLPSFFDFYETSSRTVPASGAKLSGTAEMIPSLIAPPFSGRILPTTASRTIRNGNAEMVMKKEA
mgnify:CR=1 FL=1